MNVACRVDSSSKIGLGHLMRCLVLVEQYDKDNIFFIVQDLKGNANHKIIDKGYELVYMLDNSVDELCKKIELLNIDHIIFDHYGIDYKFEKLVKKKTGVQILALDDTYEKHYCDVLINHNIYANKENYKNLLPEFCDVRCGKKFTLIRDEFKNIQIKTHSNNTKIPIIFVCLGASDNQNIGLSVLEILTEVNNMIINFATTSSNIHIGKLQAFAKKNQNINIHVDSSIADLMNNSNLAIVTPSNTLNEVMFLQLPFIAIKTADNQEIMYQYLCKNNYSAFKKNELSKLLKEVSKYV